MSTSATVGIASAQARRDATIAPAAFAKARVRASGQRDDDAVAAPSAREDPIPAPLHHDDLRPAGQERLGRRVGLTRADGHLDLLGIPDDHGRVRDGLARCGPRVLRGRPERGAMVEVVDADAARGRKRCERGGPAGLLRQRRPTGPEKRDPGDRLEVELRRGDLEIGGLRLAVEKERKSIRRMELAKHDRGAVPRIGPDPAVIDAKAA